MYKVYADGVLIHCPVLDKEERTIFSPTLKQSANSADSFSFSIYPSNVGYNSIVPFKTVIEVYQGDKLISRCRPLKYDVGFYNERKILCEGDLAALNDTVVRPYSWKGSVAGLLEYLIGEHNSMVAPDRRFVVRSVTVTDPNDYITRSNKNYPSTMEEIQEKLVKSLGGFLVLERVDGVNYLDYLAEITTPCRQKIQLAKNLLSYKKTVDGTQIATALLPLGATQEDDSKLTIKSVNDGVDYIQDDAAVTAYGFILATEEWSDVHSATTLKTKAQKRLLELVGYNEIEFSAADLSLTDDDEDPFYVLTVVPVVDSFHGSGQYLITKKTTALDALSSNTITIGTIASGLSGQVRSAERAAEEESEMAYIRAENAVQNATNLLAGTSGGYIKINRSPETGKPFELLIMDTEDIDTAVKVWRFNNSGWGYSSTGYNGEYHVAATLDGGIVADFITTGLLNADLIRTGTIRSNNGLINIDLDTGSMQVERYDEFMNLYRTHYAIDDQGHLVISEDGSEFSIKITSERLSFIQSGAEIAYITGHILYIKDVRVLGGFEVMSPDSQHYTRMYVDASGAFCIQNMGDEE